MAIVWTVALSWFAIQRFLSFRSHFDLGIYTQVMWATAGGHPFYQSVMEGTQAFLNVHFVPLLAVLAPIYALFPDARTLLVLQAAILASGVFPLFAFARKHVGTGLGCCGGGGIPLVLAIQHTALDDFHEIVLAVPLLTAAGAALLDGRGRLRLSGLGLALLVKEELALVAVGFGVYALFIQRRGRFGAGLLAGSLSWAALLFFVLMPSLAGNGGGSNFARHYGQLGGSPGEIIRTVVRDPGLLVSVLGNRAKLLYLWQLLAPLAGLPILGLPAALLALPTLSYLLLGGDELLFSIRYHYAAAVLPFLLLSAVWGLQRLSAWRPHGGEGRRSCSASRQHSRNVAVGSSSRLPGLPRRGVYRACGCCEHQGIAEDSIDATARVAADSPYQAWLANRMWLADVRNPPFEQFAPVLETDYVVLRPAGQYDVSEPLYPWVLRDSGSEILRMPAFALAATTSSAALWQREGSSTTSCCSATTRHLSVVCDWFSPVLHWMQLSGDPKLLRSPALRSQSGWLGVQASRWRGR